MYLLVHIFLRMHTVFLISSMGFLSHPTTSGCGTIFRNKTLLQCPFFPSSLKQTYWLYRSKILSSWKHYNPLRWEQDSSLSMQQHKQMYLGVSGKLLFPWHTHTTLLPSFLLSAWTTDMRLGRATTNLQPWDDEEEKSLYLKTGGAERWKELGPWRLHRATPFVPDCLLHILNIPHFSFKPPFLGFPLVNSKTQC